MKSWFAPAAFLMAQLRYPYKFATIFVIAFLPLVFLSYQLGSALNEEVTYLENERIGLDYVKDVRLPIEHIQQHRGMTAAYLGGSREFESRLMAKRGDVDSAFAELVAKDKRLGSQLDTAGKLDAITQRWETIKADSLQQSLGDAIKAHTELVAELLALKAHVADVSGITLDTHLDSFYLGDILVSTLPALMENMGQARAVGSGVAAKGAFTETSVIRLSVLVSNIKALAKSLRSGLQSAIDSNAKIKTEMGGAIAENNRSIEEMLNLLQHDLLDARRITIPSSKVFDMATHAISGSYKLYDALVPELDHIWKQRIDDNMALELVELGVVFVVLFLVSYLFAGFYFSVSDTIARVGEVAGKLAAGDLTARLNLRNRDEMQQVANNFNQMAAQFSSAIQQIAESTTQLATASGQVATLAQESSRSLDQQRVETIQVATAMNQMATTVQEVARNASDAADAAEKADNASGSGRRIVEQAAFSIRELASGVERSASVIKLLAQDSDEIGAVLDVIKGIAEQTNLLALNAAIEAARAGEQGRGFAVVADEVRTLARRTQESTQEIEKMIDKLQSGARNAVEAMRAGQEQAGVGVKHTTDAGEALGAITNAVTVISLMNAQIASAAEEQSTTAEEMNQRISNINTLAEKTADSARQSTASSGELSRLAVDLNQLVRRFKIS